MKSKTYLNHHKPPVIDSWHYVKAGAGAYVEQTTGADEMHLSGAMHDMSGMDPLELMIKFEEYEDVECEEEWVI
jgi:hypothetical protein